MIPSASFAYQGNSASFAYQGTSASFADLGVLVSLKMLNSNWPYLVVVSWSTCLLSNQFETANDIDY